MKWIQTREKFATFLCRWIWKMTSYLNRKSTVVLRLLNCLLASIRMWFFFQIKKMPKMAQKNDKKINILKGNNCIFWIRWLKVFQKLGMILEKPKSYQKLLIYYYLLDSSMGKLSLVKSSQTAESFSTRKIALKKGEIFTIGDTNYFLLSFILVDVYQWIIKYHAYIKIGFIYVFTIIFAISLVVSNLWVIRYT